jgi:hypothetical protein
VAKDLSPFHVKVVTGDQEKVELHQRIEDSREEKKEKKDMFGLDGQLSLYFLNRRFFQASVERQGFASDRWSSVS